MKVLHVCPTFTDGLSYQENYLTKYHKKMRMEVTVITSRWVYDSNGKLVITDNGSHINQDGVKIIRLDIEKGKPYSYKFKRYRSFYKTMDSEHPDILFVHGCQWVFIDEVIKFKKNNPFVKLYIDNHADYTNSASSWISKNILHGCIWRYYAKMAEPYTEKFYGVMPSRVDILTDLYHISRDKCELLVMGADDDFVEEAKYKREDIRKKYGICKDDFLILTGGKIDKAKKQTLLLMRAIQSIKDPKVKLLIFGSVSEELKAEFNSYCNSRIKYIGWVQSSDTYEYIAAADLVVYPGRHSVLWEQTVAQGIPMICRSWPGTHHVDVGGNVCFLNDDSEELIRKTIEEIYLDKDRYEIMKRSAVENGLNSFLYSEIAKRSIGLI